MKISSIRIIRFGLIGVSIILGWLSYLDYQNAQVTVEWSTASELNTIGFNIYRGDEPGATRQQLNQELIPSSTDSLIGGEYAYLDFDVEPGVIYYYWLEDVEDSGASTLHGPIDVRARGKVAYNALALLICMGLFGLTFLYSPQKLEAIHYD